MEKFIEELSNYSNELIIIGVLILAFVSLYSRILKKKDEKKTSAK